MGADTIKVLNDDDALELFKKTLPGASSFIQTRTAAATRAQALQAVQTARRGAGHEASSQLNLIALALRGKSQGFEKVMAMIDDLVGTLKKEHVDDDHKKEYCLGAFD